MSGSIGRIFISHASRDRHIAEFVCATLEHRGLACWISSRDVAGGDNYQAAVYRAIRDAKVMVLVFSSSANKSDEIKKELALASQNRLVVIPLRIEDVAPDDAFAFELATRQWIDAFPGWDRAMQRIVVRIMALAPPPAEETVVQPLHAAQPAAAANLAGAAGTAPPSWKSAASLALARSRAATVAALSAASGRFEAFRNLATASLEPALARVVVRARTATRMTWLCAASGMLVCIALAAWLSWPNLGPNLGPNPGANAGPNPGPNSASVPGRRLLPPPLAANPPPAEFEIHVADEGEIRDHIPANLSLFRFALNPQIIVLDFASLRQQGLMLNRVAALIEKAGMPRDRVLNDTELDQAIRAGGDTVETFYYGHDYSAAELARFFALAGQDGVRLNAEEETLRRILRQLRWFTPGVQAALISIPVVGANEQITASVHGTILHNELAHGEYFSNPAYAAYVHRFWTDGLTDAERAGVRRFLQSEEYDVGIQELVETNMQAYLMFTRDPAFFAPAMIGMTPGRLTDVQAAFLRGMPPGWLHDVLATTLLVRQLTPATAH